MKKYRCTLCGYIYDPANDDSKMELQQELHLKNYLRTGVAQFVEQGRNIFL